MKYALQLYTLRDAAAKDLPGTLKKVREIGWEYVQWSGMPEKSAEECRAALDAAGLKCVAGHISVEAFEQDYAKELAFWQTLGATDIAPGGMMKDCQDSLEAWLGGARRLDALGAKLKLSGIRLSYHNHAHELEKFADDPRTKLDILYAATSPDHLCAEFDLAWLQVGGANPAEYIRKYPKRCPVVHAKDTAQKKKLFGGVVFCALGAGLLDWPAIFAAGKESGIEWYIYEQDSTAGDIWQDAATSYAFLKKNLDTPAA